MFCLVFCLVFCLASSASGVSASVWSSGTATVATREAAYSTSEALSAAPTSPAVLGFNSTSWGQASTTVREPPATPGAAMTTPSLSPSFAAYGSDRAAPLTRSLAHPGTRLDLPGESPSAAKVEEPSHRLARLSAAAPSPASKVTSQVTPGPRPVTATPGSDSGECASRSEGVYSPVRSPVTESTAKPFAGPSRWEPRGRRTTSRGDAFARTLTVPIGARSSGSIAAALVGAFEVASAAASSFVPVFATAAAGIGEIEISSKPSEMTVASQDWSPALTTTRRATMSSGDALTRRDTRRESHTETGGVTT